MENLPESDALRAWRAIPAELEKAIEGLSEDALDLRGRTDDGAEGLSIREIVHHLVEANLVAANIMIAALAMSGCTYDWSWLTPGGDWMKRMGYDRAPVRPALATLKALCAYIAGLVTATEDGFRREVRLLDAPGAELYTKTVEGLLRQEVEHAEEHLRTLAETRGSLVR
jgi:hypothetical protein